MKCAIKQSDIKQSDIIQEDPVTPHYRKGEPLKKALSPLRQNKKATIASGLRKSLILMVTEAGIEPARRERRGILNRVAPFASYNM